MRAIKSASIAFRSMLTDGGLKPSTFLLARMRDESVPMPERVAIAEKLVQYELPRLAQIQADVSTDGANKSHEEWVRELGEDLLKDRPEGTLQ